MAENRTFQLQRDHFQTSEYKENTLKSLFLCCLIWLLFDLIRFWYLYDLYTTKTTKTTNQLLHRMQWTIYSATTILEKCRKVVLEKWFCKLGFFFLVDHFSPTWKKLDLWYKTTISRTRFLEPDFSNQISKNCKNRGRRIKGWQCVLLTQLTWNSPTYVYIS